MKGLTIKEPWASLIVNGYKKYEKRIPYKGKLGLWNYDGNI